MNLVQYAILTFRTTGVGSTAAEYFARVARDGNHTPASRAEAARVLQFVARFQVELPGVMSCDRGEGAKLFAEAGQVAAAMRSYLEANL